MPKFLVVLPTYNEIENLPIMVEKLSESYPKFDILVVDDNSPDGTGKLADKLTKKYKNLSVLHRKEKAGLGKAYINAFQESLKKNYDYYIQMDIDGSHQVSDLQHLLDALKKDPDLDLIIGSRYIKGGKTQGWSKVRELISRSGNLWIKFCTKLPIKDATAGYRIYSARAFKELIDFDKIDSSGFGFQIDMTYELFQNNGKIKEVPITFVERELGTSKMSKKIIIEAFFNVIKKRSK